ncbi:MAG: PQQ-binding-like beta-propeller repeat protein [Planctomycetes bacterium]|nr:PQQ-binding-like beta-propeller repeat protein [Planctomycetota bacterium]
MLRMRGSRSVVVLVLLSASATAVASEARWPGWRGDGTGVSRETGLPIRWDEQTNIAWKTPLPGEGNSSPIVWGDRVFVTASTDKGASRHVICIDAASGTILWDTPVPRSRTTKTYPKSGFALSTPATDGQRVYAFFDSPGLVAVDMDGKPVWVEDLGEFTQIYNMAASPVLCDGSVILVCDHDGQSFLEARDAATGRQRWRTDRDVKSNSTSPTVIEVAGSKQIVVPGPTVTAYDPADGQAIWWCEGMMEYVTPTAVFDGRLVYVTSGRNGPAMAIDPTGRGDVTRTHVVMSVATGGPYVPSPVVYPVLALPNDNGNLRMIDAGGRVAVEFRAYGKFSASPVAGEGRLYWINEAGDTYVLDVTQVASDEPRIVQVAVNPLGEKVLASPAVAAGRIYIRTERHLYSIAGNRPVARRATPRTDLPHDFNELAALYKARIGTGRSWAGEDDQDAAARLEVLEHMARTVRTAEAAAFIAQTAIDDKHYDILEESAKLLGQYGPLAEQPCIRLLTYKDSRGRPARPFTRIIAAGHLRDLQSDTATDALLAGAKDRDAAVRAATVEALGSVARAHASRRAQILPALQRALDDDDSAVARAAVDALAGLAGQLGPDAPAVAARLRTLAAGDNRLVSARAAEALKAVTDP